MASQPKRRTQVLGPDYAIAIDIHRRELVVVQVFNPVRGSTGFTAKSEDGRPGVLYHDRGEEIFSPSKPEPPIEYEIMQTGAPQLHGRTPVRFEGSKVKTGTDVNLAECRSSGYPVVEHGKLPMKPEKLYRLTISNPAAWNDSGTRAMPHRPKDSNGRLIRIWQVDTWISYKDLWEQFERGGDGIKAYCDFANCPLPHWKDGHWSAPKEQAERPKPTYLDFASLAGIVHSYQGIQ